MELLFNPNESNLASSKPRWLEIKLKDKNNVLLLSKERKWKEKRFKLEFFDLGEKWAEDFKGRQFDLIVFQTQSCFLGIVWLSFKEYSVFIDLVHFLCDAVGFRIEKGV